MTDEEWLAHELLLANTMYPFGEGDAWKTLKTTTDERFWRLVKFNAMQEPDRQWYYTQLEEIEQERRRRERIERLKDAPYDPSRLTLQQALERLDGVTRAGKGRWRARCPIHGSRGGTLMISEDEARPGEPRIHCFAGCSFVDIVRYLKTRS